MSTVPQQTVDDLRATDLAELAESYGVRLERNGVEFKACCPFHDENTPSFSITPSKNLFYCFGCGATGGPIDFVMQHHGVDFRKAIEIMGGAIPANENRPARQKRERPPEQPDPWQRMPAPDNEPALTSLRVNRGGEWCDEPVVMAWPYRNAAGELLAYDCRIEWRDDDGDLHKEIHPTCWMVNTETGVAEWRRKSLPEPRPLYGSELLAAGPTAQVLVVEGCKTADAARRLFAGKPIVVVSWMGGGKAVSKADWSLLAGRKVAIWPDCDSKTDKRTGVMLPYQDQPGMSAALSIAGTLAELGADVRIVEVPAPGELVDGWDLADAEVDGWDGAKAIGFLKQQLRTVDQIAAHRETAELDNRELGEYEPAELDDGPIAPPEYDYPEQPNDPAPAPISSRQQPFKILGWDRLTAYYLPHNSEQIIGLTAASHTKNNLIALAPLSYWEREFRSEKKSGDGVAWDLAINALIQKSQAHGIYDPDLVRGRGAWWEDGRWAVHLGDRVILDGDSYRLREAPTRYIYEKSSSMQIRFENPLPPADAVKLVSVCERLRWSRPISGKLLAGWVFLAPICGALDWRPHVWITGGAGSGKSTVLKHIIGRCLDGIVLMVEGATSEAGIRQKLAHDARPVLFEEFESDRKKSADRVDDVMEMVTRASSESGAQLFKGSGDGNSTGYKTRAMFAFASIAVNIKQFAASTRITVLEMYGEPETEATIASFRLMMDDLFATLTPDYIQRLQARAVHMIPVIRQNATTFSEAAAIALKSRRMGDQIGTLLAGVYALYSSKPISREEALAWINKQKWDDVAEVADGRDETGCVSYMLAYQLRVDGEKGAVQRSIGELIERAARHGGAADDYQVGCNDAKTTLARHGIRVEGDGNMAVIAFANEHRELRRILSGTQWEASYSRTLSRINGADKLKPSKFGAVTARGVRLPITAII